MFLVTGKIYIYVKNLEVNSKHLLNGRISERKELIIISEVNYDNLFQEHQYITGL